MLINLFRNAFIARNLSLLQNPCIVAKIITGASKYIYRQGTTFQLCAELYGGLTAHVRISSKLT